MIYGDAYGSAAQIQSPATLSSMFRQLFAVDALYSMYSASNASGENVDGVHTALMNDLGLILQSLRAAMQMHTALEIASMSALTVSMVRDQRFHDLDAMETIRRSSSPAYKAYPCIVNRSGVCVFSDIAVDIIRLSDEISEDAVAGAIDLTPMLIAMLEAVVSSEKLIENDVTIDVTQKAVAGCQLHFRRRSGVDARENFGAIAACETATNSAVAGILNTLLERSVVEFSKCFSRSSVTSPLLVFALAGHSLDVLQFLLNTAHVPDQRSLMISRDR